MNSFECKIIQGKSQINQEKGQKENANTNEDTARINFSTQMYGTTIPSLLWSHGVADIIVSH